MVLETILFVVSFIIAAVIVNKCQQLFMRLMGADAMYFSMKKKLIAIVVVWLIIFGFVGGLFGLGTK